MDFFAPRGPTGGVSADWGCASRNNGSTLACFSKVILQHHKYDGALFVTAKTKRRRFQPQIGDREAFEWNRKKTEHPSPSDTVIHQSRLRKNSREMKQATTCINGEDRTLKLIRRTFRLHRLTLLYLNLPISYSNFFSIDRTRKIILRTLGKNLD